MLSTGTTTYLGRGAGRTLVRAYKRSKSMAASVTLASDHSHDLHPGRHTAPPPPTFPLLTLDEDIQVHSKRLPTRVSLRTLVDVGLGRRPWLSSLRDAHTIKDALAALQERLVLAQKVEPRQESCMRMAVFLHQELPVRFARSANQLDSLELVQNIKAIRTVRDWYAQSFKDIRAAGVPDSVESERKFMGVLEGVRDRHSDELVAIARGIYELRQRLSSLGSKYHLAENSMVHRYLDMFYVKRIALRILINHYLALHHEDRSDYVGIVCMKTPVKQVVEVAAGDAAWICRRKYGVCPEILILGQDNLTFPYVPEHLYYILMELIKNSLRAVVEQAGADYHLENFPPIKIIINKDYSLSDGSQVIIKVSDEGGGIPPEAMERIWCYLFTTAEPSVQAAIMGDMHHDNEAGCVGRYGGNQAVPLAGLGYGLPMSRTYAQYFGGDLEMMNRPGQGLDAIVRLSRLGDKKEPLV